MSFSESSVTVYCLMLPLLTGETADIVVPMKEVTEEQRAQIEDIVTRKTGIGVENIVITPMSSAADTAAEESAQ